MMDIYRNVFYKVRMSTIESLLKAIEQQMWSVDGQFPDLDDKIDELHDWLVSEHRECAVQLGYKVE